MTYVVKPSKGDFLLFTVMNLAGYNDNNDYPNFYPLRSKVREQFAREINNPHVLEFYRLWLQKGVHDHPPWVTLVDIQRKELGEPVSNNRHSEQIRQTLDKFSESVGFDQEYEKLLPEYLGICSQVEGILGKVPMEDILNKAWEFPANFGVVIVPRPLDKPYHGDGPRAGNFAVSLIGPGIIQRAPTFEDPNLRHLVAHEVSHSYAEVIEKEIMRVAQERGIVDKINEFARRQKAKNYGGMVVLIETMMRAIQQRYIDPHLQLGKVYPGSIEKKLVDEHERGGFEHIFKFDEVIRRHKENPKGTLAEELVDASVYLIGGRDGN